MDQVNIARHLYSVITEFLFMWLSVFGTIPQLKFVEREKGWFVRAGLLWLDAKSVNA